jgi:hypothetical protein
MSIAHEEFPEDLKILGFTAEQESEIFPKDNETDEETAQRELKTLSLVSWEFNSFCGRNCATGRDLVRIPVTHPWSLSFPHRFSALAGRCPRHLAVYKLL